MTGEEVVNVPEPYNSEESDTCSYTPPTVSLVRRGNYLVATIRKGSSDSINYSLLVDGVEQSGISITTSGVITGYTISGTESSIKIVVTDDAGYTVSDEITLTPSTSGDEED